MKIELIKNLTLTVFLFILFYLLEHNTYFFIVLVIMFYNFEKYQISLIFYLLPLSIYFLKILSSFSNNLSIWEKFSIGYDNYFNDLKQPLLQLKCNYLEEIYKGTIYLNGKSCPIFQGYGNFWNFFKFNYKNLDTTSNIIALVTFLILIILIIFLNKIKSEKEIIFFSVLSPTINLLINQQNLDLIIFLLVICVYLFIKNNKLILFLLFLMTLFKMHPYFSLFGLLVYSIKNKEVLFKLLSSSLFLISTIYILLSDSSAVAPTGPHNATGLLSFSQYIWIEVFNRNHGYRTVIVIFIFLAIISFFLSNKIEFSRITISAPIDYAVFFWTLGVYLYANYDYRNILLILYLILFGEYLKTIEKKAMLIYLYLSPFFLIQNLAIFHFLGIIKLLIFIYIFSHLLFNLKINLFNIKT